MRSHSRHQPAVSPMASSPPSAARSEPELVVAVMNVGPLCVRCLAKKSGVPRVRVERVLGTMARIVTVRRRAICHACLDGGTVFRLT